ncbi:hypothetical protein [Leptospira neocaledonica]|uniref:hypothetical protein n=1 Tax=Leptospira neocaledonica TaxID=2023192 RepID=UPI000F654A8A|nr:hypothetical protein [Leptospira neocaledonica]
MEFKKKDKEEVIKEVGSPQVEPYFSNHIFNLFRKNQKFQIDPKANAKIRITTGVDRVQIPTLTMLPGILTLGLFPFIQRSYGNIQFELIDSAKNKVIKIYKYNIEHRYFLGWASIILGLTLPLFSDRFEHSGTNDSDVVMKVPLLNLNPILQKTSWNQKISLLIFLHKATITRC